ncbi:MAG: type II toxin-antitoxin system PemK/MazF family toxin [Pseudonocardia sp.]|nr:type II toxin-antitoxin system PemK/MazF family toxin [Pseudonocardia sp.]
MANWGNLLRQAAKIGMDLLASSSRKAPTHDAPRPGGARPSARSAPTGDSPRTIVYAPDLDGSADPGEIVWAWVPFEENDGRGKDRPLLVVGRQGSDLVGLMLSSQQERSDDRDWVSIGTGDWDRERRESFVRLDRVLEVGEHDIRREGAVLDRGRFDGVAGELRGRFGWS